MTGTDHSTTDAEVTPTGLRHAMSHFATGVTVITSLDADGQPAGTTANAVSSLSLDPPLLLACLDRSSQTLAAVLAHGAFAVNVLAASQAQVSANFARRGLAADWDCVPHRADRQPPTARRAGHAGVHGRTPVAGRRSRDHHRPGTRRADLRRSGSPAPVLARPVHIPDLIAMTMPRTQMC